MRGDRSPREDRPNAPGARNRRLPPPGFGIAAFDALPAARTAYPTPPLTQSVRETIRGRFRATRTNNGPVVGFRVPGNRLDRSLELDMKGRHRMKTERPAPVESAKIRTRRDTGKRKPPHLPVGEDSRPIATRLPTVGTGRWACVGRTVEELGDRTSIGSEGRRILPESFALLTSGSVAPNFRFRGSFSRTGARDSEGEERAIRASTSILRGVSQDRSEQDRFSASAPVSDRRGSSR